MFGVDYSNVQFIFLVDYWGAYSRSRLSCLISILNTAPYPVLLFEPERPISLAFFRVGSPDFLNYPKKYMVGV